MIKEKKVNLKKSSSELYFTISLVVLAVAAWLVFSYINSPIDNNEETQVAENNQTEIVAEVNKTKISRADFERQVGLFESGEEINEEQRQFILNQMINNELFLQDAQKRGISAGSEEINSQYDEIVQQFESREQLTEALVDNNLTEESVKLDIADQIILQKYLEYVENSREFTANETEVNDYYERLKAEEPEDLASLEDIYEIIEEQVINDKINNVLEEIIEELRAKANIKTYL